MPDRESDADREVPSGGQGGVLALDDSHHTRAGLRMLGRAIREEWPIPMEKRPAIVERVLARSEGGDDDLAQKADELLVKMTAVNQRDAHHVEKLTAQAMEGQADRQTRTEATAAEVVKAMLASVPAAERPAMLAKIRAGLRGTEVVDG